jgi:hypothetical protein
MEAPQVNAFDGAVVPARGNRGASMQHAPIVNDQDVAGFMQAASQRLTICEPSMDGNLGELTDLARWLEKHLIPPNPVPIVGRVAEPHEVQHTGTRTAGFEDGSRQDIDRDCLGQRPPIDKQSWNVSVPLHASE